METVSYISSFLSVVQEMTSKLIPDEIIVMTAGAQVTQPGESFVPAFVSVYLAVAFVLTLCYIFGAILGAPLAAWLYQRRRIPFPSSTTAKGRKTISWILCLSIFFPGVRHLVPFFAGIYRLRLRHYLLVFLTSSFLWTFHYYVAGYWMSDKIDLLVAGVYRYSKISLTGLLVIGVLYALVRQMRRRYEGGAGDKNRRGYS